MFYQKLKGLQNLRLSFLLIASLVLGGTSQYNYDLKLPLYIISLIMIGLIFNSQNKRSAKDLIQAPTLLLLFLIALSLLYLIPLPSEIWGELKGRKIIIEGYLLLEEPIPSLPLSLYPERTFLSLFDFLPVIAVGLITILSNNEKELRLGRYTLLISALFVVFLGLLQTVDGQNTFSLYKTFNINRPIGFFTNTNHFACLMAMIIPIALWTFVQANNKGLSRTNVRMDKFLGGFTFIAAVAGILLSGSSAGYLMILLSIPICLIVLYSNSPYAKFSLIAVCAIIALLLADFFIFSSEILDFLKKFQNTTSTSRLEILQKTLEWRGNYGLFGIGPGAFQDIYTIYVDKNSISNKYVNNAHNDYIQFWTEFGIFGLLSMVCFLVWYLKALIHWFKKQESQAKINKIYIIALFMPIIHSTVDYSLRTMTISTIFAFMIAMVCRKNTIEDI